MPSTSPSSLADKAPSITPLIEMLALDIAKVNETILARMASDVPLIPQLAGHLIASGGKRIRPMMTIAGAILASGDADKRAPAIKLATAVEFIHSATLLHDDVIDESELRRGQDTANALWGNDASVLVGDFLFARAFELIVEAGNIAVLGRLASASAHITEGEIKQMTITGAPDTAMDDYLEVISGKTAILFAAAAAAGAEVTGGDLDAVDAMHSYGMHLGMAFQIMDDALDYSADAVDMGKNTGDDFTDQKITLPVILAWRDGSKDERDFWQRTLGDADFQEGDLQQAQQILIRHAAISRSMAIAADYAKNAGVALAPFYDDERTLPLARALDEAARFAAYRTS
ncbi:polyprenyl synthetase family protein [Alphaproteobacteria bacterium]|nr:polyprenyl synthetase family protein [Alphaproteobacteria bacterium]